MIRYTMVFVLALMSMPSITIARADWLNDAMNSFTVGSYKTIQKAGDHGDNGAKISISNYNVLIVDKLVLSNGRDFCLPKGFIHGNVVDIFTRKIKPDFDRVIAGSNDNNVAVKVYISYLAKKYPCGDRNS